MQLTRTAACRCPRARSSSKPCGSRSPWPTTPAARSIRRSAGDGSARLRPRASHRRTSRSCSTPRLPTSAIATSTRSGTTDDHARRPLVLDLGAVAKGLAIDLAARELRRSGTSRSTPAATSISAAATPTGAPWSVGIRHPATRRRAHRDVRVSDCAVCTSGDYERRRPTPTATISSIRAPASAATAVASATVVAPTAMLADALGDRGVRARPGRGHRACSSARRRGLDRHAGARAVSHDGTRGATTRS